MSTWTQDELRQIDNADELQLAAVRRDGTLRGRRPIWVVRVGDNLYVRAAYGTASGWHQVASDTGHARISVAGVNKDVAVERADETLFDQVDGGVSIQVRNPLPCHRREHHRPRTPDDNSEENARGPFEETGQGVRT